MPSSGSWSGRPREPRRGRSGRVGAPYLVPGALALAAAVALWLSWDRLTAIGAHRLATGSIDAQVKEALSHQDRAHLDEVYGFRAGGTAELFSVRYRDVAVRPEEGRAAVLAVVEADGRVVWRDEAATLAYVGRERFTMSPCPIALWCGDGNQFARLRGVLVALFRREDAFNGRDPEAYARLVSPGHAGPGGREALLARLRRDLAAGPQARERILGWQIRVERDRATAGEDYELRVGDAPPQRLRARYELALEGDRWAIVGGL